MHFGLCRGDLRSWLLLIGPVLLVGAEGSELLSLDVVLAQALRAACH